MRTRVDQNHSLIFIQYELIKKPHSISQIYHIEISLKFIKNIQSKL